MSPFGRRTPPNEWLIQCWNHNKLWDRIGLVSPSVRIPRIHFFEPNLNEYVLYWEFLDSMIHAGFSRKHHVSLSSLGSFLEVASITVSMLLEQS